MSVAPRIPWTRQWVVGELMYERTYRCNTYHDDIGEGHDCVPCQCWPCPIKGHIRKIMMKYWTPETEVTWVDSIWQLTSSYHPSEAVSWAALEHYPVLHPDQQYYGIAANVYLRAGRALIRVIIMMADGPVNQSGPVGAAPTTYQNQTHWDWPRGRKKDPSSEKQDCRVLYCWLGLFLYRY